MFIPLVFKLYTFNEYVLDCSVYSTPHSYIRGGVVFGHEVVMCCECVPCSEEVYYGFIFRPFRPIFNIIIDYTIRHIIIYII